MIILALLFIKHFLCDFVWQTNEMVYSKGTYGKLAGINHSLMHTIGTFVVLMVVGASNEQSIILSTLDGIIHYHVDWLKSKLTIGLTPVDHKFWVLLGADQLVHYLTYAFILAALI